MSFKSLDVGVWDGGWGIGDACVRVSVNGFRKVGGRGGGASSPHNDVRIHG